MYGVPISLRYKSGSTYQTIIGGLFTIMTRLAILSYLVYGLMDVYQKKNSIVKKTLYRDMFVDKTKIHLTPDVFDVGLSIQFVGDPGDATDNIFRYVDITFAMIEVSYDQDGNYLSQTIPLNYSLCTEDRFGGDLSVITAMGLTSNYCSQKLDNYIYGSQTGESSQHVVYINQCKNATLETQGANYTCANQSAIDTVFDLAWAQIVVMSSYFDAYEFDESPIKKQYRTYIYSLKNDLGQGQDIYVAENELITYDSQIGSFFGGQTQNYLDTTLGKAYTGSVKEDFIPWLGIYFMISNQVDSNTRTVRSIMDCLTETGGFSNVIGLLAKFSILKIQQQLFYESLIKKMFKVQRKPKKKIGNSPKSNDTEQVETGRSQKVSKSSIVSFLASNIPLRIEPQVSILKYRIRKVFCFCRNRYNEQERMLFDNALAMLDSQFDIVKMMQSVRSSQLLQKLVLTQTQRDLIPYFSENVIPTTSVALKRKNTKLVASQTENVMTNEKWVKQIIVNLIQKSKQSTVTYKILKELLSNEDIEDQNIRDNLKEIYHTKLKKTSKRRTKKSLAESRNNDQVQAFRQNDKSTTLFQNSHVLLEVLDDSVNQESIRDDNSMRKMLEPISDASIDFQGKLARFERKSAMNQHDSNQLFIKPTRRSTKNKQNNKKMLDVAFEQ